MLWLSAFLLLFIPWQTVMAADKGVITGDNLNVRDGPSTSSDVVGQLHSGKQVQVLSKTGDWYKISFGNGHAYVHKAFVKVASTAKSTSAKASNTKIKVYVNGEQLTMPIEPPMKDDRVLVPFREIGEALGIKVFWLAETRQVSAVEHNRSVLFTINKQDVIVNGDTNKVNPAPIIVDAYTVIPLRFFAENFGAQVSWDPKTLSVFINREENKPPAPKQVATEVEEEQKNVILDDEVSIYPEPFSGGDPLGVMKQGDEVEVKEVMNNWLVINFDGETGYVYREFVSGYASSDYDGVVNATELNVRAKPSIEGKQIGSISRGARVKVFSFDEQWAKIEYAGQWGYVHSYYLDLYKDGRAISLLVQPKLKEETDRAVLTWAKQGKVTSTHAMTDDGVKITTSAHRIQKWTDTHPGIDEISYNATDNGTTITVELDDDYHYVVRHTFNDVRLIILEDGLKGKRIVVDAGHGAHDSGAVGVTGLLEKSVNLSVATKLKNLLENAGAEVIMTRYDDTFIPLENRVKIAHENNGDAFISIHADSFRRSSSGSTTFYHSAQNPSYQQSKILSDITIKKLTSALGTENRGSNDKSLHVIRETEIPAILVELAFLSNPNEEGLLKQDSFRDKAAKALFDSLNQFYE